MLYSKIIKHDKLYISLHAEQVYQNFNKFDDKLGYFATELTRETLERVGKEIQEIENISSIIMDYQLLEENRNSYNELEKINKHCARKNIEISQIRVCESLYGKMQMHKFKSDFNLKETFIKNNNITHFNLFSNEEINVLLFDDYVYNLYENMLLSEKKLYVEEPKGDEKYSFSSNVELPRYLNIKKYIEEKELSFFGLYLLCKKSVNYGLIPDLRTENRPAIVFPSITASYLASIIAKIGCCDIAYRDHIGPKNKLYRTIHKGVFKESKSHLIISDVVCMGTEIQITKNLIEHEGGKLGGVLAIVDVKVTDKTPVNNVVSLVVLTRENNTVDYKIKTNF